MQELSATRTVTEAMTILKAMPLQAGELAPVHELGRAALKHVLEDCMRDKVRQYLEAWAGGARPIAATAASGAGW